MFAIATAIMATANRIRMFIVFSRGIVLDYVKHTTISGIVKDQGDILENLSRFPAHCADYDDCKGKNIVQYDDKDSIHH